MASGIIGLAAVGHSSAASFVGIWGGSATIAGILACFWAGFPPDISKTRLWFREQRDLAYRYLGEFTATTGALQFTMFLVAALAGLTAVGSLRAGFLLFGPVLVLFQGSMLALVPEGVKVLAVAKEQLRRSAVVLGAVLVGLAIAWGAFVMVLPESFGRALLGDSWPGARALALPLTVMFAASGAETALRIGLRSLAAARQSLKATLIEAGLTVSGGTIGAFAAGAEGVAWGMAVVFWLEVGVWWWQFTQAVATYPSTATSRKPDLPQAGPAPGMP
jgi:hypothetical protein